LFGDFFAAGATIHGFCAIHSYLAGKINHQKADPMDPRTAKQLFIITCIGFFTFGLLNASMGPLLEQFATNNSVPLATIGSMFTAMFTGGLLAQLALGQFTNRMGEHRGLAGSFLFLSVFLGAASLSRSYPLTLVLVFFAGMGYGLAILCGNILISRLFEKDNISALNWLNVYFGIGDVVGPLLVSLSLFLWKTGMPALWIGSAGMLLVAAVLALIYFKVNIAPAKAAVQARSERVKLTPFLFSLTLMILVYVGSETTLGSWATTYMHRTTTMGMEQAALVTAGFWLMLTLGRIMGAVLGSRISALNLLKICLGISLLGAVVFVLGYGNLVWSIAAVLIMGFGFGAVFPTTFGVMTSFYRENSGKAGSIITATASLSGMTLPWLVGVIFAKTGMRSFTFALALLMFLMWGAFLFLANTKKKADHPAG
jgi:fucose permease